VTWTAPEVARVDPPTVADERAALDGTFQHERYAVPMDLRWVYLHMIEEYARHNGHADLLREQIDGATGD
jgi:hypothetical protein